MSTHIALIEQYIPEHLRKIASDYTITEKVLKENIKLVVLILESKSMDTPEEKQNWFNLLPLMTAEQVTKLDDILTREKQKLAEIESKYQEKKQDIKDKYVKRWESMWYTKKIDNIKKKEEAIHLQESEDADALLEWI